MTFQLPPKRRNTNILALYICKEDKNFNTSLEHDACLTLEDENGVKCGVEYIQLNEFANYYSSITSSPSEDVIPRLIAQFGKEYNDEDLIEYFIDDLDTLYQLEEFRFSAHNQSKWVEFNQD